MIITAVTEDTASCYRTYGLIPDCIVGNGCRQEWKWMLSGTGIWWAHRIVVIWNIFVQGYNRAQTYRPQERIAPQGARVLLMDGTAVESAFELLLTKVTKPP